MKTPIKEAASLMSKEKYSAVLITSEKSNYIGIVTDHDLRERVVAKNLDINSPVFQIMSSPIISIDEHALMFEASLLMHEKATRHLAVKDNKGNIISMISNEELLQAQRHSSSLLISEIQAAGSAEEVMESNKRLSGLIKALIDSGAKQENITRIITSISDVITDKLIKFALKELGDPPVKFAFVALGSVGRGEQTLKTDQDNAIIFEDVSPTLENEVQTYFVKLGIKVCGWLNLAGYTFCIGEVMAQNPKWCQPLKAWKEYFTQWIVTADPEDLRDSNIFFDFKCIYGDKRLTEKLKDHLNESLEGKAAFFQILASNVLLQKPPIGLFGKIVVESVDGQPETFNIKHAIRPIVDFARIYSLKNQLDETNTLGRLHQLLTINVLNKTSHDEIIQSYNYLMQLRFKHQVMAINNNQPPDNNINPKKITHLEQTMLKKTFSQISDFQSRLKFDFTGTA
ncbi:MAG: CBS domain-containing protein [Calditrichia bacterium]|nr:CBS domain-containing protein [Calditrichia bacterium]